MRKFPLAISAVALSFLCSSAHAATLSFGATTQSVAVDCGFKLKVTQANAFGTLQLVPPPAANADPIFTHVCKKGGITISNPTSALAGLGFSIDCGTNQFRPITGDGTHSGITLQGFGLAAFNCYVDSFNKGIVTTGDAADIEDNRVTNCTGDGFSLRSTVPLNSQNLNGLFINGNRSINNGGWGFNIAASGIDAEQGSFFFNTANGNGKGGFLIKGNGNTLSGGIASSNKGPGIFVVSTSCCSNITGSQDLDTFQADNNAGPAIIYAAKDDGSNSGLPTGFDSTPGGIDVTNDGKNASCPAGSVDPTGTNKEICLKVLGKPCSDKALNACP